MSFLRVRLVPGLLLVSLVVLAVPARSQAPAPAPGVSTGEKIGTIIKTAISTAAPGISSILDLIWGHLSNPNTNSAKKTDLTNAANNPQVQQSAKQQMQVAAQQAIQPVSKVSDELGVINRFLRPSVIASEQLVIVKTKMSEATTDWTAIGNAWNIAKPQIANLKSVQDADLNKVRDAYLRLKLGEIRGANDTTVIAIDQEVSQKNLPDLKADVLSLLSVLSNMTALAGYELAELQADIGDLAAWAKGGAGGATIPDQQAYVKFLNANLK